MRRVSLLLALSLVWALPASAQVHGGNLGGSIKDQQAGVLPGATVTVRGVDATESQTTAGDGTYHFLNLAPGSYQLSVALTGFATAVGESLIEVGKTINVDVVLSVATVNEAVSVNAAAPMVNATPVGTAINFTHDELTSIPTSRDPFALIRAVPGALTDRVNVGGNETGQQLIVLAKGARQQDTSWTLDGVEITDMASPGQSATYFNFDNFDEIHVSTAGNDIRERTGALTIDLSVKRGGNQLHGSARGYFSDDSLQAANIPDELKAMATPVTPDKADHLTRSSDYGFDIGGPLLKNRAWFYGSYSMQNVQVYRRTTNAIDRTTLNDPNAKINVQASSKDMVSFLWYNGIKVKDNRGPGLATFEKSEATWHQENQYTDNPMHGLWKIADDHVFSPHLFASAKYAYFNTGIALVPEGGMDTQAGVSNITATSYGSVQRQLSARPQHTATIDANSFFESLGLSHNIKFGGGIRKVTNEVENQWPGNMIKATIDASSPTATVYREGHSSSQINYVDFYVGDTVSLPRVTIDLGVRYDRQWGKALPSSTIGNPAFPSLVPGIVFSGYDAPFTWKNFSPRAGLLINLDERGSTTARVAYSQFAGQLAKAMVDYVNPTATAGGCVYPWSDANGDGFAQPGEVNTSATPSCGGGFNVNDPTAVTSSNRIDANLKAPITRSIVGGFEREVMAGLAASVTFTYSRTSNLFGDAALNITPRVGVPVDTGYAAGPVLTGVLPDGSPYSVPTYVPNHALVVAGGSGSLLTTIPGYYTDYRGLEIGLVKRLSKRWMGRATIAFNNAREHFPDVLGKYDTNGNPTPTVTEPLVDGGQFAPATTNGGGAYYLNAKWQVNVNAMYQAPYGIEIAANVFGRQGYPFPLYRAPGSSVLGADDKSLNVLVTPQVDTFRYPNVWDTDMRLAKELTLQGVRMQIMGDVFNVFNANTALLRVNKYDASNFNALSQNLSPRVVRVGVSVGF